MTPSRIGRYEIQQELGRGAMAVVYKAVDPLIGRVVAIKTIRLEHEMDMKREELRKRLYREAQSAGVLNHPNIVTIYDIGEQGDLTYIAMEFVEGESLDAWLARHPIPPLDQTLSIVEQIALGLDFAGVRGIIHRDIKPGNILLTTDMRAKIADFGIAKLTTSDLTLTGVIMGTPSYMSPEQAMGKDLDGRSDLWSLGVIFYQMLTGERPFPGSNPTTIIYKIVHEEPIPPRKINLSLHPSFDYIIRRMLAKDPAQRYQNCAEHIRDLKNYQNLGGLPPQPAPVAVDVRPQRSYISYAIASVLALAVMVLGFVSYQAIRGGRPPIVETKPAGDVSAPAVLPKPPTSAAQNPKSAERKPEEPRPEESKMPPAVARVSNARLQFQFSGQRYPVSLFEGTRKVADISPDSSSLSIPPGDHKLRVVNQEIFLDRPVERTKLVSDQVYPIVLPGLASAYIELPDDAYDGCEILLNGKKLPTPYPAQIPKLAAGRHQLVFRWSSGKYAGKTLPFSLLAMENHHLLITGDPRTEKVQAIPQ